MNRKIYLSGAMEFDPFGGVTWRQEITPKLESIGYEVLDPADGEREKIGITVEKFTELKITDLEAYKEVVRKNIILRDYLDIIHADIMLLKYDEGVFKGAGSISEAAIAYVIGTPIIVVSEFEENSISGWLLAEIHQHFSDFESALEFLGDEIATTKLVDKCRVKAGNDPVVYAIYQSIERLYNKEVAGVGYRTSVGTSSGGACYNSNNTSS